MGRVKTFSNGGSLLPGDLNSIEDDYEFAFSTYKDAYRGSTETGAGPGAATYLCAYVASGNTVGGVATGKYAFYLDPADYLANTRTSKCRLRAQLITNATAPTTNWTFGLYPVATWGGAANNFVTIATVGAVVPGSTVAFNTPGATANLQGNSGDFNTPAVGWYVIGVVNSGAAAASAVLTLAAALQVRQV